MQFPVTIQFHSLGWRATLSVNDASGVLLGYSPLSFDKGQCLGIYSDETMARRIFAARLQTKYGADFVLLDGQGAPIGKLAAPKPKGWSDDGIYVVSVGTEERFEIVEQSPGLHLVDYFIDPVPVVNVLTGLLLQPCHVVRRRGGGAEVMTIVKRRTMFDASYRLEPTGALDDRECECVMLASVMVAIRIRRLARSALTVVRVG